MVLPSSAVPQVLLDTSRPGTKGSASCLSTIPKGTYTGQEEDVLTVSVQAVILANDTVSEDAVYTFVADIFDNAKDLTDTHAKYAELSLDKAASITTVPYHPGAVKYFDEKGKKVTGK